MYPRHRAHIDQLGAAGSLWMIGTLPTADGRSTAMAVFRTEESARSFRSEDPLFADGLASASPVQRWQPLTFQP